MGGAEGRESVGGRGAADTKGRAPPIIEERPKDTLKHINRASDGAASNAATGAYVRRTPIERRESSPRTEKARRLCSGGTRGERSEGREYSPAPSILARSPSGTSGKNRLAPAKAPNRKRVGVRLLSYSAALPADTLQREERTARLLAYKQPPMFRTRSASCVLKAEQSDVRLLAAGHAGRVADICKSRRGGEKRFSALARRKAIRREYRAARRKGASVASAKKESTHPTRPTHIFTGQ